MTDQREKRKDFAPTRWQEVLISLRQIMRATDLQSRKLMKKCGLTIPQVVVLRAVRDLGNVTVRRISEQVSLSQATVTTILNRLEQRGLVKRARNSHDKRVVNVTLTDDGARVLDESPDMLQESFITRFEALEPWEQTLILSSLQRVAAMLEAEDFDAAPLLAIDPADRNDWMTKN